MTNTIKTNEYDWEDESECACGDGYVCQGCMGTYAKSPNGKMNVGEIIGKKKKRRGAAYKGDQNA